MAEKVIRCEFAQLAVGGLYDVHVPKGSFTRVSRATLMSIVDRPAEKKRVAMFDNGVEVADGTPGAYFERIHIVRMG